MMTRTLPQATAYVLAFLAVCATIFVVLFRAGGGQLPNSSSYHVQAVVPDAIALAPAAEVREAGLRIGRVDRIATRAGTAVLALSIDKKHAPLYRDASVQIGTKSLLGENNVEIDRGSPSSGALADGGVLPLRNADPTTQLDQILSTLDPRTRAKLQHLLNGLGTGLRGHGADLNDLLHATSGSIRAGEPVVAVLSEQRRQVARIVENLGTVTRAIGDRGASLRQLAGTLKVSAAAVARRDRDLRQSVEALPATLRQVRATTRHLGAFSSHATPVVGDLATALERLRPVVSRLGPAARETRGLVDQLDRFASVGRPLLRQVASFSRVATPAVGPLDRALAQAGPLVEYLSPFYRELGAFFANLSSATNYPDATGHVARAYGMYSADSASALTGLSARVLDYLFEIGALGKLRTHENDPYPMPGQIGAASATSPKTYPRLTPWPPARR